MKTFVFSDGYKIVAKATGDILPDVVLDYMIINNVTLL